MIHWEGRGKGEGGSFFGDHLWYKQLVSKYWSYSSVTFLQVLSLAPKKRRRKKSERGKENKKKKTFVWPAGYDAKSSRKMGPTFLEPKWPWKKLCREFSAKGCSKPTKTYRAEDQNVQTFKG